MAQAAASLRSFLTVKQRAWRAMGGSRSSSAYACLSQAKAKGSEKCRTVTLQMAA